MKKLTVHDEISYIIALLLLALAVAMSTISDFGVSMIVAPAYILSLKFEWLSFGVAEYIIQGILVIILCIILKKVKLQYFFAFMSCLIYGLMLDLIMLIPIFNPSVYTTEVVPLYGRILYFIGSIILTGVSVAILVRIYLYPQVYDFFSQKIGEKINVEFFKVKLVFDISSLVIAFVLTFILFREIRGIGIGTIILAFVNSLAIKLCGMVIDKIFIFKPFMPKVSDWFNEKEKNAE